MTNRKIVQRIMKDSKRTMWFTTNCGAYKYKGASSMPLFTKDGDITGE
jgi:hypothetical protein